MILATNADEVTTSQNPAMSSKRNATQNLISLKPKTSGMVIFQSHWKMNVASSVRTITTEAMMMKKLIRWVSSYYLLKAYITDLKQNKTGSTAFAAKPVSNPLDEG
jgi:hypothetical protein